MEICPALKVKALARRARAYEGMGHYKQALTDMRQVVKVEPETEEYTVGELNALPPPTFLPKRVCVCVCVFSKRRKS